MNRRQSIRAIAAILPIASSYASEVIPSSSPIMIPTKFIDSTHPTIVTAVNSVAPAAMQPRDKALRIHDFVRDKVLFGWASSFYDQTASEVLSSGVGFCNTKGTLFVAMLRAAGIPARQHFVDIRADILSPYINPGTPYVDHSYTEVQINGTWLRVDSYIVDKPLFMIAKRRLEAESRKLGFGVHSEGTCDWDGQSDAFAQYVQKGSVGDLSRSDHGIFDDIESFYASGRGVNRLNPLLRLGFGLFARSANQKIQALRNSA